MRLVRLWLKDFRCYEKLEFEVPSGITVVMGDNAQGKTSLLEAVGWLARASSFRSSSDSVLVRAGAERAVIRGEIERNSHSQLIEVEIAASGRNRARVNRQRLARVRDLTGIFVVTVFGPDDVYLIKGGPAERRNELDRVLASIAPRYSAVQEDYERVVQQRNAWLKGLAYDSERTTLDVWDAQLVRVGTELLKGRLKLLERLAAPLKKIYGELAGGMGEANGRYEASWAKDVPEREELGDIAELLADGLARSRAGDLERRMSLVGPHRDDWRLSINGVDARRCASQGEQRSLALAVRLAGHAVISEVVGETPVLLLDDVFSELDEERCAGLAAHLPEAQAVITTVGRLPVGLGVSHVVRVIAGRFEQKAS